MAHRYKALVELLAANNRPIRIQVFHQERAAIQLARLRLMGYHLFIAALPPTLVQNKELFDVGVKRYSRIKLVDSVFAQDIAATRRTAQSLIKRVAQCAHCYMYLVTDNIHIIIRPQQCHQRVHCHPIDRLRHQIAQDALPVAVLTGSNGLPLSPNFKLSKARYEECGQCISNILSILMLIFVHLRYMRSTIQVSRR